MLSISVITVFLCMLGFFYISNFVNRYYDYISNCNEDLSSEIFDFIVVGAGSAGAVVANRLSKNSRILLIEAGGDPNVISHIAGMDMPLLHQSDHDWMHKTVPQKDASLLTIDSVSLWPRGKVLGGTSILNFMQYVRGHPMDYNNWANITNDKDWLYENLLDSFKASINYGGRYKDNKKHYGETPYGYLDVSAEDPPLYPDFIEAGKELGFDEMDYNGPQRTGFSSAESSTKNGKRSSTYAAFIKNFKNRKNFKISRYSIATKIHIDKHGKAVGVWYDHHGTKKYARASREIIISAGAVDSPKLLMLSGIGPEKHLRETGIKPKVNLPVGENLQDHLAVLFGPFIINDTISFLAERDFGLSAFTDYYFKGTGPLSLPSTFIGQAFFGTSSVKKTGVDWPNIQLYMVNFGVGEGLSGDLSQAFGWKPEVVKEFYDPVMDKDAIFLMPVLVRPKSVGEIKLKDKNYKTPPVIDPKYLSHPDDIKDLMEAVHFAMKIPETKAFKKYDMKLSPVHFAPCKKHKFKSDAYFECYIRHFGMTLYHPASTCSMGQGKNAVVDSKLRVIGVRGLRVADASIMPKVVNGNTNAPSIMIGEKVSKMIREYWAANSLICDKIDRLLYKESRKCYYNKIF